MVEKKADALIVSALDEIACKNISLKLFSN